MADHNHPLIQSCYDGDLDKATQLVCSGANLEMRDDYGYTPLTIAARFDCTPIVGMLIAAGADENAEDDGGMTIMDKIDTESTRKAFVRAVELRTDEGCTVTIVPGPMPVEAVVNKYEMYEKMLKACVPEGAVRNRMTMDGLTGAEVDFFFEPKQVPAL